MSLFVECPFCHKSVLKLFMNWHLKKHTDTLPDGQMKDHVTVKEPQRYTGSLEGIPQVYVHSVCGGGTGMPEEIVRSYLANPFLYNNRTFCTGCNDYVHMGKCTWHETGEQVLSYRRALMKKHLGGKPLINCTREFVQAVSQMREDQNSPPDAMLRIAMIVQGNSGRLNHSFVTECDSETDWRGEFHGMTVLVNFDESANYLYGKTFDFRNGQVVY